MAAWRSVSEGNQAQGAVFTSIRAAFYKASVADDATLSDFARVEEAAQQDRALALRMSGLSITPVSRGAERGRSLG